MPVATDSRPKLSSGRAAERTPADEVAATKGRRHLIVVAAGLTLCVAAVGAGIGVWDAVKYRFVPKRFGVVVPGEVYRSGQISAQQFAPTIEENGIDVVIDLNGIEPNDADQAAEIAAYGRLGLEHYRFRLRGNGTGDVGSYVAAIVKLAECHRDGKSVLVHCHAGTQRTGSVIAAYRLLVLGSSPREAYEELSRYGWDPETDQVLLDYLNRNLRQVAEELARRGLIEGLPEPLPVLGP
jgi:Dual specificity phosphatase, catalytic domain